MCVCVVVQRYMYMCKCMDTVYEIGNVNAYINAIAVYISLFPY